MVDFDDSAASQWREGVAPALVQKGGGHVVWGLRPIWLIWLELYQPCLGLVMGC